MLGLELIYCHHIDKFKAIGTAKINYSAIDTGPNSFQIRPSHLLFEDSVNPQQIKYVYKNEFPCYFPINDSDLIFDPLAACFYVISRYEEYVLNQKDQHQRFPATASLQHKTNCLHLPIAQIWSILLADALKEKFPSISFHMPEYRFLPTYDIDMAWSYREKGFFRSMGACLKSIGSLDFLSIKERWKVATKQLRDPFDTYDYIERQNNDNQLNAIYFFLLGVHSAYDKNISPTNAKLIQLIKEISLKNNVGIHPSYYSEKNLKREINSLSQILKKEIKVSRQHYVRLILPGTYDRLIANNISDDYTMGYPDMIGFRNGLAIASPWYNLSTEQETELIIHPFQIMDVTLKNYLQLTPDKALEKIRSTIDTVKKYGGTCISIWHNSSFDTQWSEWKKVYEEMLSYASK